MKCDEFLSALESGGIVRRIQARMHAVRCSRCAALQTSFEKIKQQWKTSEPLSPRARLLWERAANEASAPPPRRRLGLPVATGLAVAACVLLILVGKILWQNKIPLPQDTPVRPPNNEVVRSPIPSSKEPAKGLALLADDVDRLELELRQLERDAQKKSAQQQITLILDQFGHP